MAKVFEKEYLRRAKLVSYWLQLAPFVRMVGLNGSLSRGEARETSDIDFLIIARKNRIWTCRAFVTFITELSGYRRQGEKIAGMICLNRYQTDDFLTVLPQNEYHARVFSQLIPLVNVDETHEKYLKENLWMKKKGFLLKDERGLIMQNNIFSKVRVFQERLLKSRFGDSLERLLKNYQKKRILEDKRTSIASAGRIRVSDKELCFHPIKEDRGVDK